MITKLLLFSIVVIACLICNKIFSRLGIPMLLAFILLGMFFGSDGVVKIAFDNYEIAEEVSSVALIFIMFYGGFGTKWKSAQKTAVKSVLLSTVGVFMTAGITGIFCYYVLHIPLLESFLIGALISSTDAASVFSILRSKHLNLKYNTAPMLEVESGSNDPCAYMLTVIILTMMEGNISGGEIVKMLFSQIFFGLLFGVLIAVVTIEVLKRVHFRGAGFDDSLVMAVAVLAYALSMLFNGNGYLSTYICGMILGNSKMKNKNSLVHFFDGVTGLMQMFLFFMLGLLSFPSQLPKVIVPALCIAVFLTFVARPVAVFLILSPFRSKFNQQLLVSWAGLRGAASIVFAIMAVIGSEHIDIDIFHIVFLIVLFSILLQGSLLPFAARKLHMIDDDADVMKTFTDYVDEVPVQFIQFKIKEEHLWNGQVVKDILLPPDTILVLLLRMGEKIVPNGDTVLLPGDKLILSAKAPGKIEGVSLTEKQIEKGDKWEGKTIARLPKEDTKDMLIIMIKREDKTIIPNGDTVLQEKDVLVINYAGE